MLYNFRFNKIYAPVFRSDKRIIDIWGGRARGGSHFCTEYFLFLITQPHYFRGYFVRQTFHDIKDSLFRDFKDRIEEHPTIEIDHFSFDNNEMRIVHIPTGNMIISKGVKSDNSRSAKMKSLAGATHVVIEEADEVGEDDFDQLDLSLRTTKSKHNLQILRNFNPPGKNHWIWRDYNLQDAAADGYFTATTKSNSNVLSIFSTYYNNRVNVNDSTIQSLERFRETNIEYYNTTVLGLISEGMKGRIYRKWSVIKDAYFDTLEYESCIVIDFGFSNDPCAIIECKHHNQKLYVRELCYQTGMTNLDIAKRLIDLKVNKNTIIADNAEPKSLRELRVGWEVEAYPILKNGIDIIAAQKGQGSIAAGITKVKEHEVYMTEGSTNGWKEYASYAWALDKNKLPTDAPVDKDNHIMDCIRMYANNYYRL